jgi:hypothetical protein
LVQVRTNEGTKAATASRPVTAAQPGSPKEGRAEAQARQDAAAQAEEARVAQVHAAEAQRVQALAAKAANTVTFVIAELGVSIQVPGDVVSAPFAEKSYGDPAIDLTGEASGFRVVVTDASADTLGLEERKRQQQVDFTYGVQILRATPRPDGGWGIEYSDPVYSTAGERMGVEYGYFGRRVVGGKKYNCFHAGQTSPAQTAKLIAACDTLRAAGAQ